MANLAVEAVVDVLERAEALQRERTDRADHPPLHLEQLPFGGVEKEVDRFGLGDPVLLGEGERVDVHQLSLVVGAQQRLQPGDQPRAPGLHPFQLRQLLVQHRLVDAHASEA
ncbi:MAG: hypothetical protein QM723_31395 [Myxococcaceae bacterium]